MRLQMGLCWKKKKKEEVNEANEIMDTIANNKLNWGHAEAWPQIK